MDILRDPTMSSDPLLANYGYEAGRRGAGMLREAPGRFILRRRFDSDRSGRPLAALRRGIPTRMDPPDHTRVRDAMTGAFTPALTANAKLRIEEISHRLIDSFERAGSTDLMSSFAFRLPLRVMADVLGIPIEDHESFRSWAIDLITGFDLGNFGSTRTLRRADLAAVAMTAYLSALASQRRAEPRDDLLSALALAGSDGEGLSATELAATISFIVAAGRDTTANLIGNSVWTLHKNLAQRQRFIDEPDLGRAAIEELLRLESPMQLVQRIATTDREHHGTLIPAGRPVVVLLGAANRDPDHFRDPQRFDMARGGTHPIAFGYGAHHCIGTALASSMGLVSLQTLYQRLPGLRPIDRQPRWRASVVFRGLERLPVKW